MKNGFPQSVAQLGVWPLLSAAVVDHRMDRPSIFKIFITINWDPATFLIFIFMLLLLL